MLIMKFKTKIVKLAFLGAGILTFISFCASQVDDTAGGTTTQAWDSTAGSQLPAANHNVGADCMSCHFSGSARVAFTIAGTAAPGSVITITDSAKNVLGTMTANVDGNFYSNDPKYSGQLDAMTSNTAGGYMTTIDNPIVTANGDGSCNTCHGVGATPAVK